jgi:hypothetical protein
MIPKTLEETTSMLDSPLPMSRYAARRHSWQTPDCRSYFIPRSVRILGSVSPDAII